MLTCSDRKIHPNSGPQSKFHHNYTDCYRRGECCRETKIHEIVHMKLMFLYDRQVRFEIIDLEKQSIYNKFSSDIVFFVSVSVSVSVQGKLHKSVIRSI